MTKGVCLMPRGEKSAYTDKQKRQAEHIEEGYEERGVPEGEAERRAWATVNKQTGGGKKSGAGRGKTARSPPPGRAGGKAGRPGVPRACAPRHGKNRHTPGRENHGRPREGRAPAGAAQGCPARRLPGSGAAGGMPPCTRGNSAPQEGALAH